MFSNDSCISVANAKSYADVTSVKYSWKVGPSVHKSHVAKKCAVAAATTSISAAISNATMDGISSMLGLIRHRRTVTPSA